MNNVLRKMEDNITIMVFVYLHLVHYLSLDYSQEALLCFR